MESLDAYLLFKVSLATNSPASVIASLACTNRAYASFCRESLWPMYCQHRLLWPLKSAITMPPAVNMDATLAKMLSWCPGPDSSCLRILGVFSSSSNLLNAFRMKLSVTSYRGLDLHKSCDRGGHVEMEIPFSRLMVQQLFSGVTGDNCGASLALLSPCHHWITRCKL